MRVQSIGYPAPVALTGGNDGSNYVEIQIAGAVGRRFAHANWDVNTSDFFDNFAWYGDFDGGGFIFGGYLQNETAAGPTVFTFSGATANPVLIRPGTYQVSVGYVGVDLLVETGIGTDAYVALAESGLDYDVVVVGSPGYEVAGGPEPPEPCFWNDLVRVQQTGCG